MNTLDDEYEDDLDDRPQRKAKSGLSGGMKILIGLLIFGALSAVVCCGVGIYLAMNVFSFTEDATKIAEIREEIIGIDIPEEMPPQIGVRMNMFGAFKMEMAGYGTESEQGLLLMQMQVGDTSPEELERQLKQQMNQQAASQGKNVTIESSETRVLQVAGEDREFVFAVGKDQEGNAVRQVSGTFTGRNGAGMILFILPEEEWSEETVLGIIQSIRK